jgi:uncharacterized repeat protein (TIGR03803 family)
MPTPISPTIVPVGPSRRRFVVPSLEAISSLFFYHVKLFALTWVLPEAEHAMGESPSARPRNNIGSRILSATTEGLVKPVHFVCVCLMLAGTIVLAQFGAPPLVNQGNGLPFAQQPQPGQPPNLSRVPQAMPFVQPQRGPSRRRHVRPQVQNGPEQVLYAFQGGNDGSFPSSDLIFDSSGNLYGTTQFGGVGADCSTDSIPGCGTVFELSPNGSGGWTETVLYTFQAGTDGSVPSSGLIFDNAGNLYGTTLYGGAANAGTVFELSPNGSGGWKETILYSFLSNPDGSEPQGLIFDGSGNLYGATEFGGLNQCYKFDPCGTVFELSPNGSRGWTETIIYSFHGDGDGFSPNGGLIFDNSGNLYGTTSAGGLNIDCGVDDGYGCGTAFELSPNGSGGWTETVLYSFASTASDGANPAAGLILDQSGDLYGTTSEGGEGACGNVDRCGTVFKLSPNGSGGWTETTLYAFLGGIDGASPAAGLIFDKTGNLYGTTADGGAAGCNSGYGCGTVFELTPNGSGGWTKATLYSFQGASDGAYPFSGVIFDQTGHLYGTTAEGGGTVCLVADESVGCGVVFEVTREPFVTLSPTSLNFGNQTIGIASSPQAATLTNSGNLPLTITSIEITGANSSDFGQTNNCPSSLPPNNSCQISVTFTPAATGNRTAALSITDNAPGSPQSIPLTGVGTPPSVTLSPPRLTFPPQVVGTTSQPQTVQLSASDAIAITSIEASAEFGQTNNCGKGLPAGGKCQILLTLTPAASGPQNGTLTINDSGADSPQTAQLSGTGQDFSLTPSVSSTQAVAPGQVANYTVAVAPLGGFNRTVTLRCDGAPAQSTCSVSPSSVTLNGAASAPVAVTVTTAGTSASLAYPSALPPGRGMRALWLAFSGLPGLVLLGSRPRKQHGRLFYGVALLCVLFMTMTWSACGGGSSSMGTGGSGTPAGTYNLTVVGTFSSGSANLVHSTKLTLVVQ